MKTIFDHHQMGFNDLEWYLLAQFPLRQFMAGIMSGNLQYTWSQSQASSNYGVAPGINDPVCSMLISFAREAMPKLKEEQCEEHTYVRFFCPKKVIEELKSALLSSQLAENQYIKPNLINQSCPGINSGWGYFLIKSSKNSTQLSSTSTYHLVDLYFYKEGE